MIKSLGKLFIIIGLVTFGFVALFFWLIGQSENLANLSIGTALFSTVLIVVFAVSVAFFILGMILYFVGKRITRNQRPETRNQGRMLACRDVGMDCDHIVYGKNDAEVLENAKKHAITHGFTEKDLTEQFLNRLKSAIKDK
ncbi:DUF1059 domain-containing protein [Candidatus Parcubacteria bacterium]|nr:MAG: DUF1059 domain-containing protein [Candidatus Parcubacteria bacterium]